MKNQIKNADSFWYSKIGSQFLKIAFFGFIDIKFLLCLLGYSEQSGNFNVLAIKWSCYE